jgi:hypothetical protein
MYQLVLFFHLYFWTNLVKGCCHFGKHPPETQQHLFYNCKITFPLIQCIQTLFFEEDNITFDQHSMILGYDKGTEKGVILGNILIYVAKWTIWKQRNLILRQKINNTSPNIDNEINYIILKLN